MNGFNPKKFKPMIPRGYKVHVQHVISTQYGGWVVIFTMYYSPQGIAEQRTAFVDGNHYVGWNMPNHPEAKSK